MPLFFLLGRYDDVIAPETSIRYFNVLSAPSNRLVRFEESAHEPSFEEPEKPTLTIVRLVRAVSGRGAIPIEQVAD